MNDQMRAESSPITTEGISPDTAKAAAIETVSSRSKNLGEKANRVTRMVAKRAILLGGALALLVSSGCSNTEQPNTPTPAEPTPISTPEKQALTDVELVSNLLTYFDLDTDPRLKRLGDAGVLSSELTKFYQDFRDPSKGLISQPLGESKLNSSNELIEYKIPSANLTITLVMIDGKVVAGIGFPMDENGNIPSEEYPRFGISRSQPLPKEELDKLVSSGTRNFARFLKHKPNPDDWTTNNVLSAGGSFRAMSTDVTSPNGANIRYSVVGDPEREDITVGASINP